VNPYEVLQVDAAADQEAIDAAYKRLARKYHPDRNSDASSTEKMQQLNVAYGMVRNPDRRRQYDLDCRADARRARREQRERKSEVPAPQPKLTGRPGLISQMLKTGGTVVATLAVALGVYLWREDQVADEQQARVEAELADLSTDSLFDKELDAYLRSCMAAAAQQNPAVAEPYCQCLIGSLRAKFDNSRIYAPSESEFMNVFKARFVSAAPDDPARERCWSRGQHEARSSSRIPTAGHAIDPAAGSALRIGRPPAPGSTDTTP